MTTNEARKPTPEEIIAQLGDLKKDRESFLDKEEPDSVFQQDINALDAAIEILTNQQTRATSTGGNMTQERCIETLRKSMDQSLFDPNTGEVKDPDNLNAPDRTIYEAMAFAVDFLETHPRDGAHSWFYTFGTDPQFPLGQEEFVEIHANDVYHANQKFKSYFPCRDGSSLLNCAWVYDEEYWKEVYRRNYNGKKPARVID